jgi:hypothetical protein
MMRSISIAWAVLFLVACGGGGGGEEDVPGDPGPDVAADAEVPVDAATDDAATETPPELPPEIEEQEVTDEETGETAEVVLPDPTFIHVNQSQPSSVSDLVHKEDYAVLYRTTDRLADTDARALAVVSGTVWVGTATGLFRFKEGEDLFVKVEMPGGDGAIVDLAADASLSVLLAAVEGATAGDDRVVTINAAGTEAYSYPLGKTVTSVAGDNGHAWAGTTEGVMTLDGGTFSPLGGQAWGFAVRDLANVADTVFLATAQGLGKLNGDKVTWLDKAGGKLPDDDVRAVAADPVAGRVVAGCATGVARFDDKLAAELLKAGKGALPNDDVVAIAVAGPDLLIGHGVGATAVSKDEYKPWDHYSSQRFLPDDHVRAVALGADGSRWVATAQGVSRIRFRDRTLAQKEGEFFEHLMLHNWRMDGFITSGAYADDPWNPTQWSRWDEDNDGLWTQMGIGMLCYAYAATGDDRYYLAARTAMQNMFLQIDVPAVDFEKAGLGRGFVTRSLVRDDEGALFADKATQPNWHLVHYTDGHDYYWKDDTSSDETTGHFFGYPLYYDLCAKDAAERAQVADHAGALAAYIIKGGFRLLDLDGQPTSFGHWAPDELAIGVDGPEACMDAGHTLEACAEAMFGGGWLNSIEILGHMLAAWHMTGDATFYEAYDGLVTKHRYDEVATFTENVYTATMPKIANHSDHELAMLALHTLIRYEPDAGRRKVWIDSLLGLYAWESGDAPGAGNERHPLWGAFVALAIPGKVHLEDAVRSLREYPSDLRVWGMDNTHRKDAADWPSDRHGNPQFDTVFPYDELFPLWWNTNPYGKLEGGNGRSWQGPTAWLLAYWAQRYAGLVK